MMTIKNHREKLQMTQSDLAEAVGTTQAVVSRWESGAAEPSIASLRKLSQVFGCGLDDIAPAVRKLRAKDIFTKEAYEGSTAEERRRVLKAEQAKEYSGWRRYPTTMSRLMDRIPEDWWDTYSAQHIGEVMAMLEKSFRDGVDKGQREC